jgi:hypothetical protein
MKQLKKSSKFFTTIVIVCTLFLLSNCNKSGDEEDPQAKYVGTWTLENIGVESTIEGKTLEQYITENGGSLSNVQAVSENILSILNDLFGGGVGKIELKEDNTFVVTFGTAGNTRTESGSWSFNASTETLTISPDSGGDLEVMSLSSSELILQQVGYLLVDVNDDQIEEQIEVLFEFFYSKL